MKQKIKRVLVAPDKFKGSLSAMEVCQAIAEGITHALPTVQCDLVPMADGGDGSVAVLADALGLEEIRLMVEDPLGRSIAASYYRSEDAAFVEMAVASGLVLLRPNERNPLETSSFGTGMLIRHALESGLSRVYLFLGGSATNDAGMGIAEALGFRFLGRNGESVSASGDNLGKVVHIMPPTTGILETAEIVCMCDVMNPLLGENGASHVYAQQKGATPAMVRQLEAGMVQFARRLQSFSDKPVGTLVGGGAAGGIAAGLVALCNADIRSGMEAIQRWMKLENRLQEADLVITGEGKLDTQTLEGKVVDGVLSLAARYKKETLLIVGVNALSHFPDTKYPPSTVLAVMDMAPNEESAMNQAGDFIATLLKNHFEQ